MHDAQFEAPARSAIPRARRIVSALIAAAAALALAACQPPGEPATADAPKATAEKADAPQADAPPKADPPATEERSFDQLIKSALMAVTQGDRETAVALLNQAAAKDPTSHLPHQRLCAVQKALGRHAEALAACERWRAMEPDERFHGAIEGNITKLKALIAEGE